MNDSDVNGAGHDRDGGDEHHHRSFKVIMLLRHSKSWIPWSNIEDDQWME